ncbi:GIY-YIG nuclease family protein [Actinomadura rugatobispora]|uniref:GIY-YIG nuclease family protein n=1 Tax=Actinomadura rugatobispora TaxID=1994 RepID=A0ABW0ZSF8_9ACTN|nr:hypothetical protein GCM10010200_036360 [Actinomadura rugatobispora]
MREAHQCDWFTIGYGGRRGPRCSRWADAEFARMWVCAQHLKAIADAVRSASSGGRGDVPAIRAAARAGLREFQEHERSRAEQERQERRWDPDGPSVVYYLRRGDGLIKIGFSARLHERKLTLQREHGPLELLATHWGDRRTESEIHDRFREVRATGEWFRPSPELLRWISRVNRNQQRNAA